MGETTRNEEAPAGAELLAAARESGMEQLEGAKGQLAEGAERVAAAVDRTAEALEGDGDNNAISGFGHSVASLMRQLAGGLRERDVEDFARELADLARRNPGVFLAGSVALGFGIARFFKARRPQSSERYGDAGWQSAAGWQGAPESTRTDRAYDAEEHLDLSANSQSGGASQTSSASREDEQQDRNAKSRQSPKPRGKSQRASSGSSQHASSSTEPPSTEAKSTEATTGSSDSAFTGGTGSGAPQRGGKS